jgi:peptide/nickel transport system substrate-binding protein
LGLTAPLADVDPRVAFDFINAALHLQVYEPLFFAGPRGGVLPNLLETLQQRGDGAFAAAVIPGRFFSDGTPVTAGTLVDALWACRPFAAIAGARVDDSGCVVLSPRRQHAGFAQQLTALHYVVVRSPPSGPILGTGPYRFAPDSTNHRPHLERNPFFHGRRGPDEIFASIHPPDANGTPSGLVEALRRGEVDYTEAVSAKEARGLAGFRFIARAPDSAAYLFFNVTAPGLWVRETRVALAAAIDRRAYARAVFGDERAAATGVLAPIFGVRLNDTMRFDPSFAAAELARPRHRRPFRDPMRMLVPSTARPHTPNVLAATEALVGMFSAVGVKVEPLVPTSSEQFSEIAQSGAYDLALSGWNPDSLCASDTLEALLASTAIPNAARSVSSSANLARFGKIDLDSALAAVASSSTPANFAAVQSLVQHHVPLLPLVWGTRGVVVRDDVELPARLALALEGTSRVFESGGSARTPPSR